MMRSICIWGAGSSSMKPERVRGLIFSMVFVPFRSFKKEYSRPCTWDESRFYFVVPPNFSLATLLACCGQGPAISAKALYARSADVLHAWPRRKLSAGASFSGGGRMRYCFRVIAHVQLYVQRMDLTERRGWIISRQSRSPRCRPMMSISAEARLVPTGTLCLSQWRRVSMMR